MEWLLFTCAMVYAAMHSLSLHQGLNQISRELTLLRIAHDEKMALIEIRLIHLIGEIIGAREQLRSPKEPRPQGELTDYEIQMAEAVRKAFNRKDGGGL